MTILCNDLTLEQINAALLRIQRSIQTGNNNFQNDVEKAVANVTISGKTTIQRYDDSRLMAIVNELNQRYETLTREQSDIRSKIVSLETILSNVSFGYDSSSNTISYTLGDYSTDVQLKDTTYTFSYDTDTGTFTIVDEYTGETVLNQVFNDTTYTFSFANGVLTVHNNRLNTDQTFNFDSRYYTESEIQSLILDKIPSAASSSNQLADKDFVNSSIETATATFRGTVTTTQALAALTGDLNDYAFLQNIDPVTGQTLSYDRYKWVETGGDYGHWKYEYTLNNSSFTSDQWAAINSGITCQIVTDLLDGCYTGHGSALCKSNGNEWRNLLATNCDCTDAVDADYIYYNTNVRVNQCNGLLSANCYCVLGRGFLPYAMYNLSASSLGLTAGCCYSITCILDKLRCCYGINPGTYVFQYANVQNPIICETSGYAYCLSFTKLDSVNVALAWQKDHWLIEDHTNGTRWTASACSNATAGSWTWGLNSNLTACKIYRNPTCSNAAFPLFFAGANTSGFGNVCVSCGCQATFNPSTGVLFADCFNGTAKNSTCFNGCTYADACTDIRSGLISDIALDVYCDTTCKCTLNKNSSLCLSANAFNENAQISTTTYPGACCIGTVTGGSFNGISGTVNNGCLSFSNINFDNICNSPSKNVAANNITRRYLLTNQITSVGFITRWGLGLERGTTSWGTGLLSLGVKDDGTCFADYKFTHTGGISLTCCGTARCITLYGCATKNVFTCCLCSANAVTKYFQIKTKANRSSCSVSFDFDFYSMNGTINLDNNNANQYYAGGYYGSLRVSVCSYACACCDCFWLTYTGYRTLTLKSVYDFEVVCNTTTAPEGVTFCCFVRRPGSVTKIGVSDDASYNVLLSNVANDTAMPSIGSNDKLTFNPSTGILSVCGTCIGWNRTKSCCVKVTPTAQSSCWIYIGRFQTNGTADTTNTYNDLNLTIAAVGSGMVSSASVKVLSANAASPTVIVSRQSGYSSTTGIDCIAVTRSGSNWNCLTCVWARVVSSGTNPYYVHLYRNMLPDSWVTSLAVCSAITGDIVGVGNVGIDSRAIQSNAPLRIGCYAACTSSVAGCSGASLGSGYMEMYADSPYIDFHNNNYCGDYSQRITSGNGKLYFRVNNGTGCTESTQGSSFCMCSNGYFYGNVCGDLLGIASSSCKVYKTLASADADRQLLLGEATEAAGYGCVYVSDSCKVTFNPGTGLLNVYGNVQSCNTVRRSSVYSSNTYSSGWYLVAQLSSKENGSGNHDITLGGYIDMTCGGNLNLRRYCFKTGMRGNKCTLNASYAFIEPYIASDYLRITRDIDTTDCTFTLRVYAKVCGWYTRINTTIDYYGGGDVNTLRGLNASAITFPNTYVADEESMTGTRITLNCGVGTLRANDIQVGYVQCASCSYVRINCANSEDKIQINGPTNANKGFILTTENCICGCYNIGMEVSSGNINRGIYHCNLSGTFQWLQYWDASNEIHNCPAKFACTICAGGCIAACAGISSSYYCTQPSAKTCSFAANSKTYFLLGCFKPANDIYANNLELGFSVGGGKLASKGSIKALLTTGQSCLFCNNNITVDYSNYMSSKFGVTGVGFTSGSSWNCCIGVWLEICNCSSSACSWNVALFRNLLSCAWNTCMTCTTTAPTFACYVPVTCTRRNTHFNNSDVTLCRLITTEKCTATIDLTCSIPSGSSAYFLLGCYNVFNDEAKCRNNLNLAFNVNQGANLNTVGNINLLLSNTANLAEIFGTNIIDLCVSEPWGNGTRRVKSVGFTSDGTCAGVWVEVYNGYDSAMNFDVSLLPNLVANGWTSCLCCQATAPTFICCIPVPTGDKMPFHFSNVGGSSSWKSVYCGCKTIAPQCQYLIMKAGPINASTVGKLDFLLCTSVDGTDYPSKICGTLMPGNAGTDAYNPDLINASFTSTRCALYPLSIGLDSTCCLVFAFAYQCGCTFRPQLFFKNDQFNEALGSISTSFLCCDSDPTTYRTYIMANMSCQCDSGMFVTSVNANQVTANCLSTYSKRSLKKDITPYTGCALNLIGNTNVVSYRYKTEDKNSLVHIGFIADDTPELLSGENKDTMRINDSVGLLLKAVQELDERTLPFWKKITNIVRKLIRRFRNGKKD